MKGALLQDSLPTQHQKSEQSFSGFGSLYIAPPVVNIRKRNEW